MDFLERVDKVLKRVSASIALTKHSDPSDALLELREMLTAMREEMLSVKEAAIGEREDNIRLRSRLSKVIDFDDQREKFEKQTLETGSVVYVSKEEDPESKIRSYICPQCFESKQLSYLQAPVKREFNRDLFTCSKCDYRAAVPNDFKPTAMVGKSEGGWGGI